MFQEKSTGTFGVNGVPYRRAKDPRNGVCMYDKIEDVKQGIIVGIGSFVKVLIPQIMTMRRGYISSLLLTLG